MIGKSISHYEITAKLGQGGMGEVYRAADTRLHRQVALKVLPEVFAKDEERMARFEREARVLASLNHPNIAAIYGLEVANGTRVLVMELVEGDDLADRISRGPIPQEEALPIALQIAEALENAHEKGIIHRDLKPANVKVTSEGVVKVLDFGLAKALEPTQLSGNSTATDLADSPTMAPEGTVPGLILGTAAYMSPEQARGKRADKRSDIWSFGVVLWEMLTGQSLFRGETVTDVLAAVMTKEVSLEALPTSTAPAVRALLIRCLRRDRRNRLPDIGAARLELQEVLAGASAQVVLPGNKVEEAVQAPRRRHWRERWVWISGVLVLTGLSAFLAVERLSEAPELRPATHFVLDTPADLAFGGFGPLAVSPDGRSIAFVGALPASTAQLWLRRLEAPEIRGLPGTEGARAPFWSPDSSSIAFTAEEELRKLVLAKGTVQRICSLPQGGFNGGTWNGEGTIVFSTGGETASLYSVSAGGGEANPLTPHDKSRGETAHYDPEFLPDGQHLLFVVWSSKEENAGLHVTSLHAPGERRRILPSRARSLYAASGHLLFAREGILLAQPFDANRLATTGQPVTVASGVGAWAVDANEGLFSVSATGLVSWMSNVAGNVQLEWVNREGKRIGTLGEPGKYGQIVLSPDDKRVAAEVADADGRYDLWVMDAVRGVASRLTTDPADERDPVWSPDSQELLFSSDASGDQNLLLKGLQTSEPAAPPPAGIGQTPGQRDIAENWSREGNTLLYTTYGQQERSLWALSLDRKGPPELLMKNRFGLDEPQVSPDGRWLAYMSTESGRYEVYVEPFRRRGESVRVSTSGGGQPKWRGDGKELFYLSLDRAMMAVSVREGATGPQIGIPAVLVPAKDLSAVVEGPDYDDYAVTSDGQRFLVKMSVGETNPQRIHLLLDWPSLLQ